MTGLLIHSGAATWLSNFAPLAAIALCCAAYLPSRYKFALRWSLSFFRFDPEATYHAPLFDPQILCRYLALALVGLIGFALRTRAHLKTMLPASLAALSDFLRDHQCLFLADRSRLCEKFCRPDPGADRRPAAIQRDADLDVFP